MNFFVERENDLLGKLAYPSRNAELFPTGGLLCFPLQERRVASACQQSTWGFTPVNRRDQQAACRFERKAAQDFS
jgi:hypothetical protein